MTPGNNISKSPNCEATLYTPAITEYTYARLHDLAVLLATHDVPVVLDATYDRRAYRDALRDVAVAHAVPVHFYVCQAPIDLRRARVAERSPDISDATPDLVADLAARAEPWTAEEQAMVTVVDTTRDWRAWLASGVERS